MTQQLDTKATAAALRKALRTMFPATKFSVTMARGTAYGWLDVSWTDGPTPDEVQQITAGFESSRFDGGDDSYHDTGNTAYSCCGVLTHRTISRDLLEHAKTLIQRNQYGERHIDAQGVVSVELYPSDDDERIAWGWANQVAWS